MNSAIFSWGGDMRFLEQIKPIGFRQHPDTGRRDGTVDRRLRERSPTQRKSRRRTNVPSRPVGQKFGRPHHGFRLLTDPRGCANTIFTREIDTCASIAAAIPNVETPSFSTTWAQG